MIKGISAVTFATHDMKKAVQFYQCLGFKLKYGGENAGFSSFLPATDSSILQSRTKKKVVLVGRTIFHVDDVDAVYNMALESGLAPDTFPKDAGWGERYFHITDPDGHELSFACPLA